MTTQTQYGRKRNNDGGKKKEKRKKTRRKQKKYRDSNSNREIRRLPIDGGCKQCMAKLKKKKNQSNRTGDSYGKRG